MIFVRLVAAIVLATVVATPASASSGAPLLRGYRVWTLRGLGHGDVTWRPALGFTGNRISYRLPAHTREGDTSWYVIHFHADVQLAPHVRNGIFELGAITNGALCVYIRVQVSDGVAQWSTNGDILGVQTGVSRSGRFTVRTENYLQVAGVAPGANLLQFAVGDATRSVRLVRFHADSALEHTRAGPASVRLGVSTATAHVLVGRPATIVVTVRNAGGRRAEKVKVAFAYDHSVLVARVPPARIGSMRPGSAVRLPVVVRALRAGTFQLAVTATSTSNHPGVIVTVVATR